MSVTLNDNPRRRSRIIAAILVGVVIALPAAIVSVLQTDGGGTPAPAATATKRPRAPARPPIAPLSGGPIALSGGQATAVNGGAIVLHGGEYQSSAPFTIQDPNGRSAFTITQSSINQTTVGAYPNLMVGCQGTCSANSPFPLQLSSIKPGEVTTSVTSVTPSTATGTWADFYDIFITAGAHQSGATPPREELEIWQNENNRANGAPIATGVNLDGHLYDIYLPHTSVPGTIADIPETMNDRFNGDLLPFIQDSISRGYAQPNWYLVELRHGFEINGGNVVGLGDSAFSVMGR
jgi:hypothetical protein